MRVSGLAYAPREQYITFHGSIIFVHGLGGDENTWQSKDGQIFWPKDLLPKTFPNARILTVRYGSPRWRERYVSSPAQVSMGVLSAVTEDRRHNHQYTRPIVWIAHS